MANDDDIERRSEDVLRRAGRDDVIALRRREAAEAAAIDEIMADEAQRIEAERWPEPLPLGYVGELPPFPVEALPDWLASFVVATAEATQTPVDLPGCLALAGLATAAGGRAVVEVRAGWREPTNLYVAVALDPGERKTPVFQRVTAPLSAAEIDAVEAAMPAIHEARARRQAADDAAAKAQKDAGLAAVVDVAGNDAVAALRRAVEAASMAEAITVPIVPRLLADDSTPEALASLMADQGGRIAVLADEGDVFDIMAGRYSQSNYPNLALYLKGHSGSAHRVDRKGRAPEHIKAPALTLGLAVQPDVLRAIAARPGFRGRGLLARFLWSLPGSALGHRRPGAAPVAPTVTERYETSLRLLVRSLAEWPDPAVLVLTPEADAAVLDHERAIEPRLAPGGDLRHISDWAAKLAGHTVRLAGLLHIAADVTEGAWLRPLEADTVAEARRLGDYFCAHALATFDTMGVDPVMYTARRVGAWAQGRESFTRRDAYVAHRWLFPRAADLDPTLELLADAGWICQQADPPPSPQGGRPPSPVFAVNPILIAHNTHNAHNPPSI